MQNSITFDNMKNLAIVLGGVYFIYKFILGYLMINVSLVSSSRRSNNGDGRDDLVVTTKVIKGERECLQMNRLQHVVVGEHTFITEPNIDFRSPSAPAGILRMSPGEETSFEVCLNVPGSAVLTIDVCLTGWSGPFSKRIPGYWRTRVVSVPGDRQKVS